MKPDLKILQAARVSELRATAESLAAAVKPLPPVAVPRTGRAQRRFILWLLMRDRNRSGAMMEYLE
jgi:hypothetical protein